MPRSASSLPVSRAAALNSAWMPSAEPLYTQMDFMIHALLMIEDYKFPCKYTAE
jgi:hypothetical protein